MDEQRFLDLVLSNPVNRVVLERGPLLGDDLFGLRVRPNAVLAPRSVYEAKARRWLQEWPRLVVDPW